MKTLRPFPKSIFTHHSKNGLANAVVWPSCTVYFPTAGIISLAGQSLGLLFRNKMADNITRLYINQKHETIEAFNQ